MIGKNLSLKRTMFRARDYYMYCIYSELSSTTDHFVWQKRACSIYIRPFFFTHVFFLSVRSIRGLSITVKCAARDGFTGNSANWIAPYISIQQMKIDSDALPLITARRIATVI